MSRKLKDIDVDEISLVDAPANRKQFYIIKRRKNMNKLIKRLEGFFDGEDEALTDEEVEIVKGLSDEDAETMEESLDTLAKFKDSFPDDLLNATKILIKRAALANGEKAELVEEDLIKALLEDIEKAGAKLSKATIAQLRKIVETIESIIGKKEDKLNKGDEKHSPETLAKFERLEMLEAKEKAVDAEKDKEKSQEEMKKTVIAEIKKEYELKPKRGTSTGIPGQDNTDDDPDDDVDKDGKKKTEKGPRWPSLNALYEK